MQQTLLAALGLPAPRALVPHVDDLGASHGANLAFLDLVRQRRVTCGAVMVPGPWFDEIADAASADPALDIGVHLTLTSEWDTCRWAPISTTSRASGLIDDDGCFWRDVASLARHMVAEAAEAELRAQIERAMAAFQPTHIDAHMAAAMLPGLLDVHVRLGLEFGLFPVLPRSITWAPDPASYKDVVGALDRAGAPVVDHCRGTLPVGPERLEAGWTDVVAGLPPGLTHLALHCTAPGEFATIAPAHAGWRFREYAFLAAGGLDAILAEHRVATVGTRALQKLWTKTQS